MHIKTYIHVYLHLMPKFKLQRTDPQPNIKLLDRNHIIYTFLQFFFYLLFVQELNNLFFFCFISSTKKKTHSTYIPFPVNKIIKPFFIQHQRDPLISIIRNRWCDLQIEIVFIGDMFFCTFFCIQFGFLYINIEFSSFSTF